MATPRTTVTEMEAMSRATLPPPIRVELWFKDEAATLPQPVTVEVTTASEARAVTEFAKLITDHSNMPQAVDEFAEMLSAHANVSGAYLFVQDKYQELLHAHTNLTEGYLALQVENERLKALVDKLSRWYHRASDTERHFTILEQVQRTRRGTIDLEEVRKGHEVLDMMRVTGAERAAYLAPYPPPIRHFGPWPDAEEDADETDDADVDAD